MAKWGGGKEQLLLPTIGVNTKITAPSSVGGGRRPVEA